MSTISGLGGYLVVDGGSGTYRIDNTRYTLTTRVNVANTTDSTSTGEEQGHPITYAVDSIELMANDRTNDWLVIGGLQELAVVNVWLRQGELDAYDYVEGAIVRGVRTENTSDNVRQHTVTLTLGKLTRNATAPTGVTDLGP